MDTILIPTFYKFWLLVERLDSIPDNDRFSLFVSLSRHILGSN
jgi:hypothetical protein